MATDEKQEWLVVEGDEGINIAPASTPLTHLNYYDGQFLRASHLKLEQDGKRNLVHLSNVAVGFGPVYGLSVRLGDGDLIAVDPGQALDRAGRVLLLQNQLEVSMAELIALSQEAEGEVAAKQAGDGGFADCVIAGNDEPGVIGQNDALWLITIAHAEFLCGEEEVYGKLCEEACVTSTDRPYRVEGVVLRARSFAPTSPKPDSIVIPMTSKHLRSQVASAYFEDERSHFASLISAVGLNSEAWCRGAELPAGEVALGVVARRGAINLWLDPWVVRRERMEAPPRMYWAHRMAMRPWREFLSQVLQFQCQLPGALVISGGDGGSGPCAEEDAKIDEARDCLEELLAKWLESAGQLGGQFGGELGVETIKKLQGVIGTLGEDETGPGPTGDKVLIDGGIVELPPGGWLPVALNAEETVNDQVRRLMGEGVDLRFCVVRPDDVPRELEGVQHMDRISLLHGYDYPLEKPPVDILVPDGIILQKDVPIQGTSYSAKMAIVAGGQSPVTVTTEGAARLDNTPGGGGVYYFGGAGQSTGNPNLGDNLGDNPNNLGNANDNLEYNANNNLYKAYDYKVGGYKVVNQPVAAKNAGMWMATRCETDLFGIVANAPTAVSVEFHVVGPTFYLDYSVKGTAIVTKRVVSGTTVTVTGKLEGFERVQAGASFNQVESDQISVADLRFEAVRNLSTDEASTSYLLLEPATGAGTGTSPNIHRVEVTWVEDKVVGRWDVEPDPDHPDYDDDGGGAKIAARLIEDPQVLQPTNDDHQSAVHGLVLLGYARDDGEYAENKSRLLFPPPPEDGNELIVRPTLDWVFFHARHRRICALEPTPGPQVPTRTYRLLQVHFTSGEEAAEVAAAVQNGAPIPDDLTVVDVGVVEFEPGIPALETPDEDISTMWSAVATGANLAWAGIASTPETEAEGPALAFGRLTRVEVVLETITPPSTGQASALLDDFPGGTDPGEEDGVILLFTVGEVVQTTCHTIYWVNPAPQGKSDVYQMISLGLWDDIFNNQPALMREVASVNFTGNSPDDLDAAVQAWTQTEGICEPGLIRWGTIRTGDDKLGTVEDRQAQRDAIAVGFKIQVDVENFVESENEDPPGECPILTFIEPKHIHLRMQSVQLVSSEAIAAFDTLISDFDVGGIFTSPDFTTFSLGDNYYCFNSTTSFNLGVNQFSPNPNAPKVRVFLFKNPDYTYPVDSVLLDQAMDSLALSNVTPMPAVGDIQVLTADQGSWNSGDVIVIVTQEVDFG